ncbi:hypothetical protein BDV19DRAFT_392424 [Aspergillus venezuelensis]
MALGLKDKGAIDLNYQLSMLPEHAESEDSFETFVTREPMVCSWFLNKPLEVTTLAPFLREPSRLAPGIPNGDKECDDLASMLVQELDLGIADDTPLSFLKQASYPDLHVFKTWFGENPKLVSMFRKELEMMRHHTLPKGSQQWDLHFSIAQQVLAQDSFGYLVNFLLRSEATEFEIPVSLKKITSLGSNLTGHCALARENLSNAEQYLDGVKSAEEYFDWFKTIGGQVNNRFSHRIDAAKFATAHPNVPWLSGTKKRLVIETTLVDATSAAADAIATANDDSITIRTDQE